MLRTTTVDDGTVELSESVYLCLMNALKRIARQPVRRRGKSGSECPAAIARAALRRARELNSIPNEIVGSMGVD